MEVKQTITTYSIEECYNAITDISNDEKTKYTGKAFIIKDNFRVEHIVNTNHNKLNFKRKYNNYE